MSQPILELKNLDVFYGPIQALKGVRAINEGKPSPDRSNGAGKSTCDVDLRPAAGGERADHLSRRRHYPQVIDYIASNELRSAGGRGCSPT